MDNKKSVIEVFDVKKVFVQGLVEINVLNGITARFEQGKTYAITGASGSGKSTLMYLLAGLDAPDEGSVNFNGKIIAEFWPINMSIFFRILSVCCSNNHI